MPLAKDNIDQPHMHLMFSERAVDAVTRSIPEERFFKRNGAKKDPEWNDRTKPDHVREKWVEMMNGAMERAGIEQRMDARSWAKQGRHDLAELVEPKLLGGEGREAVELREQVEQLRRQREELPARHLSQAAAVRELEKRAEAQVMRIEKERDEQLSLLDKLIEKAREIAAEVKERTVAAVRNVAERVESIFGKGKQESLAEKAPAEEREDAHPPTLSIEQIMEQKLAALERDIALKEYADGKVAALDKRMEVEAKAQQEKERSREQEIELSRGGRSRKLGLEIER